MAVLDCQLDYLWNELHSRNGRHTCGRILRQEDTYLVWLHLLLEASVRTMAEGKVAWSFFTAYPRLVSPSTPSLALGLLRDTQRCGIEQPLNS